MPYKHILIYSAFFVIATVFSFLINGILLRFSKNLGMRNIDENQIRWASTSKPALGGISFYIIFLFSVSLISVVNPENRIMENKQFLGLLAAVTLAFLVGLADDAYNTRPYLKFSAQLTCGLLLASTGTYIKLFDSEFLNHTLTVIWVVGIMNSINMLDNMDAITSLVSFFIILNVLIIMLFLNGFDSFLFLILIGVMASIIGFLGYNWHPSKIYMGDTGSQFLGALLAAIGIVYLWNTPFDVEFKYQSKQILITLIVFLLPVADTTTVIINRLIKKQSPFIGGKDHTTHHLSYLGLNDKQVALLFISISLVSVLIACLIIYLNIWNNLFVIVCAIYLLIIAGALYGITKKANKLKKQ